VTTLLLLLFCGALLRRLVLGRQCLPPQPALGITMYTVLHFCCFFRALQALQAEGNHERSGAATAKAYKILPQPVLASDYLIADSMN
jgi:DMSO/TMAO reductase YedYZ heme-binding membrane subunit